MAYEGPHPFPIRSGGTDASSFNTNGAVISGTTTISALSALSLVDGQIVIGSSIGAPAAATLTAGSGVTITNGHNSISIAATGSSGSFTSIVIQTFTGSGTYTPTAGMLYCIVEAAGGGGAGGGTTSGSNFSAGGGGGSAGYSRGVFSAATIGASQTVTVGSAGTGVSANTGGNGGNTTFGALLTANGGHGGAVASNNGNASGGTGGSASSGSVNISGNQGNYGISSSGSSFTISGGGSDSILGMGGPSVTAFQAGANFIAGKNATGYGAGGGGSSTSSSTTNTAGGNGSAGIVIVTEFI